MECYKNVKLSTKRAKYVHYVANLFLYPDVIEREEFLLLFVVNSELNIQTSKSWNSSFILSYCSLGSIF